MCRHSCPATGPLILTRYFSDSRFTVITLRKDFLVRSQSLTLISVSLDTSEKSERYQEADHGGSLGLSCNSPMEAPIKVQGKGGYRCLKKKKKKKSRADVQVSDHAETLGYDAAPGLRAISASNWTFPHSACFQSRRNSGRRWKTDTAGPNQSF